MKSGPKSLTAKPRYQSELYEFSPIGYFCLNEQGRILEANRVGCALLGIEGELLVHRSLFEFMTVENHTAFLSFLEQIFIESESRSCEVFLTRCDGTSFWASVHGGTPSLPTSDSFRFCQMAILDITSLWIAEEDRRVAEALAVTNRELQQELVQRQLVEKTHEKNEAHLARLLEKSNLMKQQLKRLSHRILYVQENERKRISHELHDEITQTLVGISVHLEALVGTAAVNPKELKKNVVRTQRLVKKAITRVHRFARELRPTTLDDLGLLPSLHSFMKSFTKKTGIQVSLTSFDGLEKLSNAKRTVLYRVAHEALTNVAQHAEATVVEVSFQRLPSALLMQIKDNGKSFDIEEALNPKKNKRLGLIGMRERLEMINGQFSIESSPGKGTTIQARIPYIRRTRKLPPQ